MPPYIVEDDDRLERMEALLLKVFYNTDVKSPLWQELYEFLFDEEGEEDGQL